ncbi:MAG: DinB family protein [Terriglobales bacterium]
MKRLIALTAFALLAALAASAQSNPVVTTVRHMLMRDQHNLVAAAQYMPEAKYSYQPTAKQMTFGHLVDHIGMSNFFMCSKIAGTGMPHHAHLTPQSPKAELIAQMEASFKYCEATLAHTNDSELGEPIHLFGSHEMPKAAAVIGVATDMADHYAQAAGYLRLNGILPPTAHGAMMPMKHHHMRMR